MQAELIKHEQKINALKDCVLELARVVEEHDKFDFLLSKAILRGIKNEH